MAVPGLLHSRPLRVLLALACGILSASPLAAGAQSSPVRISEIMYHAPGTNLLSQWVELSNSGATDVDVSGWRLGRAVQFNLPAGTRVPAAGFLVVAADTNVFAADHPEATGFIGGWTGFLSHHGDGIRLEDANGNSVDDVAYANEGDWAVRRIGAQDPLKRRGWEWYAEHNGLGKSLELINPALSGQHGQNWASSSVDGGTPGRANSVASPDIAPIISDISHSPAVPRSSDPVTITARLLDEGTNGLSLTLSWRVDGVSGYTAAPMFDDGAHGDGVAGDGLFGAILAPHASGTVIEFHLTSGDAGGHSRTCPVVVPSGDLRTAYFLYQVDDSTYSGDQPVLRLIMTQAEHDYLANEIWGGEPYSDATINGTFVGTDGVLDGGSTTQVRYLCGFRNRGHGTRTAVPHNFHVAFPLDDLWKGRSGLNLNTHYTPSQQLGSAVFRRLGIPMADSRPVQVRVRGLNLAKPGQEQFGSYAANEPVDDRLVSRQFPLDPGGNLYRGIRDMIPGTSASADLDWHGNSYSAYTNAYSKENNSTVNDWSDFIHLLDVLNHTPDATYPGEVAKVADPDQWMKYFAVNTLLDNQENSLANGSGDDFALYRGVKDTRFQLLPYDMDSMMGRGVQTTSSADGLWRMTNVAAINRFMKRPEFVPSYFRHLEQLAGTAFSQAQMNPLLDQLMGSYVDASAIAAMRAFNSNHVAYVLSQFPRELTVAHGLTVVSGYPRSTSATLSLHGTAHAGNTRRVLVGGSPAQWTAWQGTWTNSTVTLRPGVNRVRIEAFGEGDVEVGSAVIEVWFDDGSVQAVGGNITGNTTWAAADGPYLLGSSITVASGATLNIEAGASVYLGSGANVTVADGGRIVAQGTRSAPIWIGIAPGSAANWGGILLNGGAGSPETFLAYVHIVGNGSTAIHSSGATLTLEHLTFGSTAEQYLSLDDSSFVVRDCVFPTPTSAFELVHGAGGVKSGGRGIFLRNYFGSTTGYNDVVDFTGGKRSAGPIVQFIGNVFTGSSDDGLDIDGTDAWVEGNIFLHIHKNGAPDSSSAVSGGSNGGDVSAITILGNIFYDCDQAVTAKQGNFYTMVNNTIVRQTHQGGLDTDGAVVNMADDGTTEGAGAYLEGNIILDAEKLVRNHTASTLTFTNNLMSLSWAGLGGGNSAVDPLLDHVPRMDETVFHTFEEAQVMWRWFQLREGSPGRGAGPNGRDVGGVVPHGVSISGEPDGSTRVNSATLMVGGVVPVGVVPASGWPAGSGYPRYKFRVDSGAWSAEQSITSPIGLTNLSDGPHHVEVIGKSDSGLYQDDELLGADSAVTLSRTWVVDASAPASGPTIELSEILVVGPSTAGAAGGTPDMIELRNTGTTAVDLAGMGLTDDLGVPYKFVFPAGTVMAPRSYLVVQAGSGAGGGLLHAGFALRQGGDDVSLSDAAARGGGLLDSVAYGIQIPDFTIGRRADGTWGLCHPTLGSANVAVRVGDPHRLRINEWLADAQFVASDDFVELYNPELDPVDLGGLWISDAAGARARQVIAPLSYIAARGFVRFVADGKSGQAADHLAYKLSPDVGVILLSDAGGVLVDAVNYGSQRTDVSSGRSPNGSDSVTTFQQPTPGGGNPGTSLGDCTLASTTVGLLPLGATWKYQQSASLDGVGWYLSDYDDSAWASGPGLLGVESSALPEPGKRTTLTLGRTTYYFRSKFVVNTNLAGFNLNLSMAVDDGAVVYLNGARLLTNGMGSGTINYSTFATRTVDNAVLEFFTLPADVLVSGTNVVAAEVHQANAGSTDIIWGLGIDASRTVTNCAPGSLVTVVLNEILADNQSLTNHNGRASDFIELVNSGAAAVDLSGLSLTDDPAFPGKWVFPAGTSLAPGSYRVIFCDAAEVPSGDNTGFGLKATGGAVYLFNRAGGGGNLLDALQYGLQAPDYSVGRQPNGTGNWSLAVPTPGDANMAVGLGSVSALRINEWMADPAGGSDWVEVFNTGAQPVAMGGLYLTDDLAKTTQSRIAPLSYVGAGARGYRLFHADAAPDAGPDHVGFSLKRTGEALGIYSPSGVMLDGLVFGVQATGVSQGRFPDGTAVFTSFASSATPGGANRLPLAAPWINEVLTHTDPPLEDAVELYNPTGVTVSIGGWYLSNSALDPRKYRFPDGTSVPAHGYLVVYEGSFNSGPSAFTFNSAHGDSVVFSSADAQGSLSGYSDLVSFGAGEKGVSFGRYATSVGVDFTVLSARTFGQDSPLTVADFRSGTGKGNAPAKVGPVVVTEIHYHPATAGVESVVDEFIELQNITGLPVDLYDVASPTNTWSLRDSVEFDFPSGVVLAPGARLLVVGFQVTDGAALAAFRGRWDVPSGVAIHGPWSGRLANDRDSVELSRPDAVQAAPHSDAGFVPQILVDRVHYASVAPWPAAAGAGSHSLQRIDVSAYGNDPANWRDGVPTAGRANDGGAAADSDADGLDDGWEMGWFGNLARDGSGDFDGDGMTDRQEFLAGTSPTSAADALKFVSITTGPLTRLEFGGVAGRSYSVIWTDSLGAGSWSKLVDVPVQGATGVVAVTDGSGTGAARFYRLVTPAIGVR